MVIRCNDTTIDPVFLWLKMIAGTVDLLHCLSGFRLEISKHMVWCIHYCNVISVECRKQQNTDYSKCCRTELHGWLQKCGMIYLDEMLMDKWMNQLTIYKDGFEGKKIKNKIIYLLYSTRSRFSYLFLERYAKSTVHDVITNYWLSQFKGKTENKI